MALGFFVCCVCFLCAPLPSDLCCAMSDGDDPVARARALAAKFSAKLATGPVVAGGYVNPATYAQPVYASGSAATGSNDSQITRTHTQTRPRTRAQMHVAKSRIGVSNRVVMRSARNHRNRRPLRTSRRCSQSPCRRSPFTRPSIHARGASSHPSVQSRRAILRGVKSARMGLLTRAPPDVQPLADGRTTNIPSPADRRPLCVRCATRVASDACHIASR